MRNFILLTALFFALFAQGDHDYISINKDEWRFGALKLDIVYENGAYGDAFGILIDKNHIVTSANIAKTGFPHDIKIKILDRSADLIICIAKAKMLLSDERVGLAMLEMTHYTDDYCNASAPKRYHSEIISHQIIAPQNATALAQNSPFLIDNAHRTIKIEQGFPYFDKSGAFVGISSDGKIIPAKIIAQFARLR